LRDQNSHNDKILNSSMNNNNLSKVEIKRVKLNKRKNVSMDEHILAGIASGLNNPFSQSPVLDIFDHSRNFLVSNNPIQKVIDNNNNNSFNLKDKNETQNSEIEAFNKSNCYIDQDFIKYIEKIKDTVFSYTFEERNRIELEIIGRKKEFESQMLNEHLNNWLSSYEKFYMENPIKISVEESSKSKKIYAFLNQNEINLNQRGSVMGWISDLCHNYKFSNEVMFTAQETFDKLIENFDNIKLGDIQIYAVVCLYMSIKFNLTYLDPLKHYISLTERDMSNKDFINYEKVVFSKISQISIYNSFTFINLLFYFFGLSQDNTISRNLFLSDYCFNPSVKHNLSSNLCLQFKNSVLFIYEFQSLYPCYFINKNKFQSIISCFLIVSRILCCSEISDFITKKIIKDELFSQIGKSITLYIEREIICVVKSFINSLKNGNSVNHKDLKKESIREFKFSNNDITMLLSNFNIVLQNLFKKYIKEDFHVFNDFIIACL
jgi:hypothetical protein